MKALKELTGSEKARLLHELFPGEIPPLIEDIAAFCQDFKENKEVYRPLWQNGFMSFEYWQGLAEETAGILKRHKHSMKSSKVFSDQLYFTYTSLFVTDRILKYADNCVNEKFRLAAQLLFT